MQINIIRVAAVVSKGGEEESPDWCKIDVNMRKKSNIVRKVHAPWLFGKLLENKV